MQGGDRGDQTGSRRPQVNGKAMAKVKGGIRGFSHIHNDAIMFFHIYMSETISWRIYMRG